MRSLEEIKRLNVKYSKPGQWACPGRSDCLSGRCDLCEGYYHTHRGDRGDLCEACVMYRGGEIDREQWEKLVSPWPDDEGIKERLIREQELQERFGLSPQEAYVAVSKEQAQRNVDIAERLGVSHQAITDAWRRAKIKMAGQG